METSPEPWHEASLWPSVSVRALGFETDSSDGDRSTTHYLLELRSREASWTISRTFAELCALYRDVGAEAIGIELPGADEEDSFFGDWDLVRTEPEERMHELEGFVMALMRNATASNSPALQRFLDVWGEVDGEVDGGEVDGEVDSNGNGNGGEKGKNGTGGEGEGDAAEDADVAPVAPPPPGCDLLLDKTHGLGMLLDDAASGDVEDDDDAAAGEVDPVAAAASPLLSPASPAFQKRAALVAARRAAGRSVSVLYTSSTKSTLQLEVEERRLVTLLDARDVPYEVCFIDVEPARRSELEPGAGLPQLHVDGRYMGDAPTLYALEERDVLSVELIVRRAVDYELPFFDRRSRGGGGYRAIVGGFVELEATGGAGPVESSARVEAGDVIVAIEWTNLRGLGYTDVLQRLRTAPNPVAIRFARPERDGSPDEAPALCAAAARESAIALSSVGGARDAAAPRVSDGAGGRDQAAVRTFSQGRRRFPALTLRAQLLRRRELGLSSHIELVLQPLRARELQSVQTFSAQDPFVVVRAALDPHAAADAEARADTSGEGEGDADADSDADAAVDGDALQRRTLPHEGGGSDPEWDADEHESALVFGLDELGLGFGTCAPGESETESAMCSPLAFFLEIVNHNMVMDEHIGAARLELSTRLLGRAVQAMGSRSSEDAGDGEVQGAAAKGEDRKQCFVLPVTTGGSLECAVWAREVSSRGSQSGEPQSQHVLVKKRTLDHGQPGRKSEFQI